MRHLATYLATALLAASTGAAPKDDWGTKVAERSKWWSLQPVKQVTPPQVKDSHWRRNAIDRFIRARQAKEGLEPAPVAKRVVLMRRLSFVLTGLPPTPAQLKRWRGHKDISKVADELFASPHFGELFARHWMDVARYTDTYGYEWDNPAKGSWRWRDYLIRAFNADIGFDQLVLEQIAGDLMPKPRINKKEQLNESLIGPMFFHLGEHRHDDSLNFNGVHQEMVNNKIDAFSKAFLATTVACARCHDHKLDAVSQRDYYALASVLMSARWTTRVVDTPERNAAAIAELKSLRKNIRAELGTLWKKQAAQFGAQIKSAFDGNPWRAALGQAAKTNQPPAVESVAHPIYKLLVESGDWATLKAAWQKERKSRRSWNEKNITVLADFKTAGLPMGWVMEGDGLHHGYVSGGEPLISLVGTNAIERLLPRGYHTHALSSKLPGSLRAPMFSKIEQTFISLALSGGEWAGHLTPVENAFQTERVKFINQTKPSWQRFGTFHQNEGWRVRMEFATAGLNPNFPPRTGLARAGKVTLPNKDMGRDKRSWLSITGIAAHTQAASPKDELAAFASLYEGDAPESAAGRIGDWLAGAVTRWIDGGATESDVTIINWLLEKNLLSRETRASSRLVKLVATYRKAEARIGHAAVVNSMDEREFAPVAYRLNERGDVNKLGDPVPRDFLRIFSKRNAVAASKGSGRLELAEFLTRPDNPLTARVYVNRVWHWVFGQGIVATPNDFGHLGDAPSHPELLDWLAAEFVRHNWSTKWLMRQMVMSRAFGQSSTVTDNARERDPDNRLLHHYTTRRLEAEAIRDSLLAVSGRLDRKLFGRPIEPPRVREHPPKRLFSGPLDGHGRRSLYLRVTIMEPPAFLVGFNFPDPKLPVGARDTTNVPAQALMLLNDPFVKSQAEFWAKQLVKQDHTSAEERIREMFVKALGRTPKEDELKLWLNAARAFKSNGKKSLMTDEQAWADLAHALFNTKEFIYYR
jgi:hypothetical protein